MRNRLSRRTFLRGTGLGIGPLLSSSMPCSQEQPPLSSASPARSALRDQFDVPAGKLHFVGFFLSITPKSVQAQVARHRIELERDPVTYWEQQYIAAENRVRSAAGDYFGVDGLQEIALTDSTTMGLGILYSGLKLRSDQEILSTAHDHIATSVALEFRAARDGAALRTIQLYDESAKVSADELVSRLERNLTTRTRVLALTWVHSATGVKLPLPDIARMVAQVNQRRDVKDRILLCVDGVHGLGVEDVTLPQLGCDFVAAGTHKWLLAPRGTGVLWGRKEVWSELHPTIAPFNGQDNPGLKNTPGGFHTFENRWAADEAFRFHLRIGKSEVQRRLRTLNKHIRDGLSDLKNVTMYTPLSDSLSAGITCFGIAGRTPRDVVLSLATKGILASESPFRPPCVRVAASLWNTPEEIDELLRQVRALT